MGKYKNIVYKNVIPGVIALTVVFIQLSQVAHAASSSLGKSGRDTTTNSTTQIVSGNDNKWVINYDNSSGGPAGAEINDAIPADTSFKAGSVQLPSGWSSQFSTSSGGSYGATDTGTSTTNLRFSNPAVPVSGNGTGQISNAPLTASAQSSTGGDAYMPIPFKGQYYGIVHHSSQVGNEIVCVKSDGSTCSGYPAAFNLGGQTDFYTSINPLSYVDKTTGNLFFAVQRSVGYGIACWNLNTSAFCAGNEYTQLSATGAVLGADQPSRLLGVVKVGSCLHAWDVNLKMYAFDPSNFSTTCGGFSSYNLATTYTLPVYVPSQHNAGTTNYGPVASAEVIDNKVYFPINYSFRADINLFCGFSSTNYCINSRLVCFDPSVSGGACAGWSNPSIGGANQILSLATGVFKDINNANNPCIFFVDLAPGVNSTTTSCFNKTSGASNTVPTNLVSNVVSDARAITSEGPIYLMASYEEVTTTNALGQEITVFPFTKFGANGNVRSGAGGCYNWTLGDECTGWGSNGDGETVWNTVNGGATLDYGYAVDESGCLLGLGDAGWIWSFSPDNGSVPCRRTVSNVTINPSTFYCDGTGNVTGWDKVAVSNLNLADFQNILVSIDDSNGNPIGGYQDVDIASTAGMLDVSGIPYSGSTQDIQVHVAFIALNNNPWSGATSPVATVTYQGDDAQICFVTTAQDDCDQKNIINNAFSTTTQLSDGTTDSKTATASLTHILSNGYNCVLGATTVSAPPVTPASGALGKTGQVFIRYVLPVFVTSILGVVYLTKRKYSSRYISNHYK